MSIGGGASEESQYSTSESWSERFGYNQNRSFIDTAQAPFLDALRENAFGVYETAQPAIARIGGNVQQEMSQGIGNLMNLGNTQQVIASQLDGLQSGLNDIRYQGMQRIGDQAEAAGAFGSGRQGIAESVLEGEIGKAFTQGYGDIIANASRQSIDANNSALAGLGQLVPQQLLASFGGLEALQGILGNPTVLSEGFGFEDAESGSFSESGGEAESARFSIGFK